MPKVPSYPDTAKLIDGNNLFRMALLGRFFDGIIEPEKYFAMCDEFPRGDDSDVYV